jgi:hypothetical protein
VEVAAGGAFAAMGETHLLDHLVVLIKRRALELQN